MSLQAPSTSALSSPEDVNPPLPEGEDEKTFVPHLAQRRRRRQADGRAETRFLQCSSDKQAHYRVPAGDRDAYVLLGSPDGLSERYSVAFDHVLAQLQAKLRGLMSLMPEYADQPHVEPRLMVYKPGTYQESRGDRLGPERHDHYTLYFSFGNHRYELTFPSGKPDARTAQRAVNRFLEEIRSGVCTDLAATTRSSAQACPAGSRSSADGRHPEST